MLAKVLKPLENGRGNRTGHFFAIFLKFHQGNVFMTAACTMQKTWYPAGENLKNKKCLKISLNENNKK